MKQIILTGDRPTGRLHVGHYVGSLKERVRRMTDTKRPALPIRSSSMRLTDATFT